MIPTVMVMVPEFVRPASPGPPGDLRLDAVNLHQLHDALRARDDRLSGRLWDENGAVRKNVVVVHNGELVPRRDHGAIVFGDGDQVEFLLQFAGG